MNKIRNIIVGWWRFLFAKRSQMAKDRVSVCKKCPVRKGIFCGICWCEIHAKAEVEEEFCPVGKWPNDPKGSELSLDHLKIGIEILKNKNRK
jgi:hypothetical protein